MKIFSSDRVRVIDRFTIENEPIESIDLMERAAGSILDWFVRHYKTNRNVVVLAGPGNNGGDALALARMLFERKYRVRVYLVSTSGRLATDCQVNLDKIEKLGKPDVEHIINEDHLPEFHSDEIVIDGLFGSGLSRVVEGIFARVIAKLNLSSATVISIDIPSGLFGEDNSVNNRKSIVKADFTLTFQFPFLSFFFAENEIYTGIWEILNIGLHKSAIDETPANYVLIEKEHVAQRLPARGKFSHKGTFGHPLVIAGSYGMMGAAVLSGEAALRAGAGLVSVHSPGFGCDILQTRIPEVIVSVDESKKNFSRLPELDKYNAICVGPGLGKHKESKSGIELLLISANVPLIIDADAINIISENPELLELLPEESILTPHPGEFDRLTGPSENAWQRHLKQLEFSMKRKLTVVLKGAYTGISFSDGSYYFNSTGNPGMATGGSGDVLSGIIVSLLAQGLHPRDAAIAGVFLHGYAGDLAAAKISQPAMIASDIINSLGEAFRKVSTIPFLREDRKRPVFQ